MNRYYFINRTPRAERSLQRKKGIISFKLEALYSENAYSQKTKKNVKSFHFFDKIDLCVSTNNPKIISIHYDSGVDGSSGHYAKSVTELKDAYLESKWTLDNWEVISESDYFRLRKLAIKLMLRQLENIVSDFNQDKHFFYQNKWSRSFYDFKLLQTSISDKEELNEYNSTVREYTTNVEEWMKIFIAKDKGYKCNTFSVESRHFVPKYKSPDETVKSLLDNNYQISKIKDFQYMRMRKYLMRLIFDATDLDISKILPKQSHSVTILDL